MLHEQYMGYRQLCSEEQNIQLARQHLTWAPTGAWHDTPGCAQELQEKQHGMTCISSQSCWLIILTTTALKNARRDVSAGNNPPQHSGILV